MNAMCAFDVETRALLRDGLQRFGREHINHGARPRASAEEISRDWKQLADHGWLGLAIPEEWGGAGGGIGDLALLLAQAGESLWRLPLIECLGEACGALLAAPAGERRDELLAAIASGQAIVGLAAADDEACDATVALSDGGAVRITGRKCFALCGDAWTHFLVTAVQGGDVGLYLVDGGCAGLHLHRFIAVDGRSAVDVELNHVAAEWIGTGEEILAAANRRAQLLAAAEQMGIAQAAFDATRRHLTGRRQFGQALLRFQALQHRMVDMYLLIRELAALLQTGQRAYDTGDSSLERLLWQVRAHASSTAAKVTRQSIQLHGGMGMTAEMPAGSWYQRTLLIDSLFGTAEAALARLASSFKHFQESGS